MKKFKEKGIWEPVFCHNFYFMSELFEKQHGKYIYGDLEFAKNTLDDFLIKVNNFSLYI